MGRSSETETKNVKNFKFNHNSISDSDSDSDEILHKKNIKELSPGKRRNDNAATKLTPHIKNEYQHTNLNKDSDVKLKLKKKKIKACKNEDNSDVVKKERKADVEANIIVKKEKFLKTLKNIKQENSRAIDSDSFVNEENKKIITNLFEADYNRILTPNKHRHITDENIGGDFQSKVLKHKKIKQDSNSGNENLVCDAVESKILDNSSHKDDNGEEEKNNRKHFKRKKKFIDFEHELQGMQEVFIKQEDGTEDEIKESISKKIKHKRKDKHIASENVANVLRKQKRDFNDADSQNSPHVTENKMFDCSSQEDVNDKEEKLGEHLKQKRKKKDFCHKPQETQGACIKQEVETDEEVKESTPKKRKHISNKNIGEGLSQDILKENKKMPDFGDDSNENESFSLPALPVGGDIENKMSVYTSHEVENNIKIKNRKKQLPEVNVEDDLLYEDVTKDEYFFQLLCETSICFNFEVPELHKLIKDVTRHPNSEIRQKILDLGLPLKQGRFTPAEDKIIVRNWNRLCARYNLPDCPEVFARWRNSTNNSKFAKARREAVLFLSRGLPDRTPVQVYHHFLHSLGCKSKGRFSEKEMETVELFLGNEEYKDLTQQFLAGVLGRDLPSVWRYIKRIQENGKTEKTKVKWTLELCETFIKKLLCLMNEKHNKPKESLDLDVLKQNKITMDTWTALAREMNLRPIQVKVHWISKLYVQLFVTEPIYLNPLRKKLLRVLQTKDYKYWQDVNWKEISSHFENYTPLFLWKKFYSLARLLVPHSKFNDFSDVTKVIHEKVIIDKTPLINKRLQRLALDSDGKLDFKSV